MSQSLKVVLGALVTMACVAGYSVEASAQAKIGVFGGVVAGGEVDFGLDCSGSECPEGNGTTQSIDDESGIVLGADFIVPLQRNLGGGVQLAYTPTVEYKNQTSAELGSDLMLLGVGEFRTPVAKQLDLTARLLLGAHVLIPGGEWEDNIDEIKQSCNNVPSGVKCEVDDGPYFGVAYGAALGGRIDAGTVTFRFDLQATFVSTTIMTVEVDSTEVAWEIDGFRTWALVGVEFGG